MSLLNPGDPFPQLTISTTDGQTLTLPLVSVYYLREHSPAATA